TIVPRAFFDIARAFHPGESRRTVSARAHAVPERAMFTVRNDEVDAVGLNHELAVQSTRIDLCFHRIEGGLRHTLQKSEHFVSRMHAKNPFQALLPADAGARRVHDGDESVPGSSPAF